VVWVWFKRGTCTLTIYRWESRSAAISKRVACALGQLRLLQLPLVPQRPLHFCTHALTLGSSILGAEGAGGGEEA
jgi:hypothetical protein